jgi:type I restriction enzyme S subunit
VAYLDKQTAKIDKAVALLTSGIEHLKAYRERLIADVVTGQLKVE